MSKKILDGLEREGLNARKYYQLRLPTNPKKDYYFILRDTPNNESIIVEYGFVDNSDDVSKIKDNYKKYAEAVVKAVCEYKGIKYIGVNDDDKDIYIVKKGDTLWDIAKKYNMSVNKLKEINNLSTNNLKISQTLKITPNINESSIKNDEIIYIVKKGDNLYNIANKYNTSVSKIKSLNNLSTDVLQINQKLKIPSNFKKYVVVKGDNLYDLAKKYDTSVSNLKKVNNLNSTVLQVGQELLIPIK